MAMILDAFVSKFSEMLVTAVAEEVGMLLNVSGDIENLRRTLLEIQPVLADAERRRIEDQAINGWLKELKDVMYDADDILDECWIEAEKKRARKPSSESSVRYHCPLPSCFHKLIFTHAIGRKIRRLNRRLEEISARQSRFNLVTSTLANPVASSQISPQKSPVIELDLVGTRIDENARSLVESLTARDERENVLVFGITGMGGVGKTTLAQKIFNDDTIKVTFPITIWLSVSQEFSEDKLLREIVTSAGGDHSRALTKASLEPLVEGVLKDKKFLLVLDDVWNDSAWHDLLRKPLQGGAAGSRVLVTTRNEGVVRRMKAVRSLKVEVLSPEDGWSLLCKKVVLRGDVAEIEKLKDIGMQIVKKCDDLPLAITTVGGVLCERERSRRAWQQVLDSTDWNRAGLPEEVQGALYLSYMDLPSHLKQCFLYCSLLKEDATTMQNFICRFWIAEGFIKAEGNLTLETTAEESYRELVRRCLLQPDPSFYDDHGFKVHDLLRLLAQSLAREENLYVGEVVGRESNAANLMKLRRLSIMVPAKGATTIPDMIRKHGSLRTLLLDGDGVAMEADGDFFVSMKGLRVLQLNHIRIGKLPPSIGNLMHLRFLSISDASITDLPDSIGDLINLQFLYLLGCTNLRNLSNSIVRLHNLRSLILEPETQVGGMPVGLGGLQHLRELRFIVRRAGGILESYNKQGEWCSLEELRCLPHLRVLLVHNLEGVSIDDDTRVRGSVISSKQHLVRLTLLCSSEAANDLEDTERIQQVFELMLSPPPCLENLILDYFFGHHFPSWIAASCLPNLRRLDLVDCKFCDQLPALGTLPSLDYLYIKGALTITTIGPEFLGQESGVSNQEGRRRAHESSWSYPAHPILFPKLECLVFQNMPNWEEWRWDVVEGDGIVAFPYLKKFLLQECPSLRFLPSGFYRHATSLTMLGISNASHLEALESLPSVKSLEIYNKTHLQRVSEFSNLETLILMSDYIEYMPKWLFRGQEHFPALRNMGIKGTVQLLQRCLKNGPDWPAIEYIPNVYGRTRDGSYYFSYTKSTSFFTSNLDHSILEASEDASISDSANNDASETLPATATLCL